MASSPFTSRRLLHKKFAGLFSCSKNSASPSVSSWPSGSHTSQRKFPLTGHGSCLSFFRSCLGCCLASVPSCFPSPLDGWQPMAETKKPSERWQGPTVAQDRPQSPAKFQKAATAERHPKLVGGGIGDMFKLEIVSWGDCFTKGCIKRAHVGMGLMLFQQARRIMSCTSLTAIAGHLSNSSLTSMHSSTTPRLCLKLWDSITTCAGLVGAFSHDWPAHTTAGWVSVAFLLFYMELFGATWDPGPWAMPAEIFPSSLRAKGVALSTSSNWINNFIIGLITPPLV